MTELTELPTNYLFQNMQTLGMATSDGSPSGVLIPAYLGQLCFDSTNSDWYISTDVGASAKTNWKKLT